MPARRYWAAFMQGVGFSSALALTEVQFRTSVGGGQAATGGTASADSFISGFEPDKAFDGNTTTAYAALTNLGTGRRLIYDWGVGNAVDIVEVSLRARAAPDKDQAPDWVIIQSSSDGTIWTDEWLYLPTLPWASAGVQVSTKPNLGLSAVRYWMYCQTRQANTTEPLTLQEGVATNGGGQLFTGGTASAYTAGAATPASRFVDGSTLTDWSSAGGIDSVNWWRYDMGIGATLAPFAFLDLTVSGLSARYPSRFSVLRSSDNANFEALATFEPAGWSSLETRRFVLGAAGAARRRRVSSLILDDRKP